MKFIITADWHIGISEGHDKDILDGAKELGEYAERNKIDGLIIAGDIYDKSRPSPFMNKIFADCLNSIKVTQKWIIPGNHDVASQYHTLQTFDSEYWESVEDNEYNHFISGDVSVGRAFSAYTLKDKKGEFVLCFFPFVSNCLDFGLWVEEHSEAFFASHTGQKRKIIITHTDIPGAKFGAEREIQLGDVGSLTVMDGFDLIISGHIHKHQSGVYGGTDFVYPGSLSRTSHAEEKEAKGFIVLNTEDLSWKFIKRKTDRKYFTREIKWTGKLPAIQNQGDVARINIQAPRKYMGKIDRSTIIKKLSEKYQEVRVNVEYLQPTSSKAKDVAKGSSLADFEDKWIAEHSQGQKKAVQAKIRAILKNIEKSENAYKKYNGLFLKRLDIVNYQSISKASKTFGPYDCVGILGEIEGKLTQSNGAGKSTILEGIRWAKYGETRFTTNKSVIRDNCEIAVVDLEFESSKGKNIIIGREITDSKSSSHVSQEGQRLAKGRETAKWVEDNFGLSLKTFDSLIYFGGDSHTIIGATPNERLKSLQEPLPLEQYEKALKITKKQRSEVAAEVSKLQGVLDEYDYVDEGEVNSLRDELKKIDASILENKKSKSQIEKEIKSLEKVTVVSDQIHDLTEELDDLKYLLKDRKDSLKQLNFPSRSKAQIEKEIADLEAKNKSIKTKLDKENKSRTQAETMGKVLKAQIEEIKKLKDKCPLCTNDVSPEWKSKKISDLDVELNNYRDTYKQHSIQIQDFDKKISGIDKELNELENDRFLYHQSSQEKKNIQSHVKEIEKNISTKNKKIQELKTKIPAGTNIKNIDAKLKKLDDKLDDINSDLSDCEREQKEKSDNFLVLEKDLARRKVAEENIKKKNKEHTVLNIVHEAFSPKGIPQEIVMSIIDEINLMLPLVIDEFNFWQDIKISLESTESGDNTIIAIWVEIGNKKPREYEGLSAGEREIVNFIIRMSYKKVLENLIQMNLNFILIDEALDKLDEHNLRQAIKYFKKAKMQSFCISHSDMKDAFNKTMIVRNENDVAEVV
jgi:DNA repair exonuclease SbcCD ATPase subunit/DNA repair exonuclease SbcCD nuclease subunit